MKWFFTNFFTVFFLSGGTLSLFFLLLFLFP